MRLWTVHPRYLDAKGLVALWREGLLARSVLLGRTRGYRHHPQLIRFRQAPDPIGSINRYLAAVADEATARGYRFNAAKLGGHRSSRTLTATGGQLAYEWKHLLAKLRRRDRARYAVALEVRRPRAHPSFRLVAGRICEWERVKE